MAIMTAMYTLERIRPVDLTFIPGNFSEQVEHMETCRVPILS